MKVCGFLLAAGAAAVLALGSCATTPRVEPESCAFFDQHFPRDAPTDLGSGLLTVNTSSMVFSASSMGGVSREVEQCSDGTTLHLDYVWVAGNKINRTKAANFGAFDDDIAKGKYPSVEAIRSAAIALGIEPRVTKSDKQSCGCAAHYPELRGDKLAYDPKN